MKVSNVRRELLIAVSYVCKEEISKFSRGHTNLC
jgi:hypothetical protein